MNVPFRASDAPGAKRFGRLQVQGAVFLVFVLLAAACDQGPEDILSIDPSASRGGKAYPAAVTISPSFGSIEVGSSLQLTAKVYDQRGHVFGGATFEWTTYDPSRASISGEGLLHALGAGEIIVSVVATTSMGKIKSGASFTGVAQVAPAAPGRVMDLLSTGATEGSITLSFTEVDDGTGRPADYELSYVVSTGVGTWSSEIVASTGTCAYPMRGTAIGAVRSCTVEGLQASTDHLFRLRAVRFQEGTSPVFGDPGNVATGRTADPAPSPTPAPYLEIGPASLSLTVGQTAVLTVTAHDGLGGTISDVQVGWTSLNPEVATVSITGTVTARAAGTAMIVVSSLCCSPDTIPAVVQPGDGGGGGGAAGLVLRSDWSTALGTSTTAVGDGGVWPTFYCSQAQRDRVMEVVPGSQAGWTLTPNVLQITNRGAQNCGLVEHQTAIPLGVDYYVRMYIRVKDENQPGFHSFKQAAQGPIPVVYWAIQQPVAGVSYRPMFRIFQYSGPEWNMWWPAAPLPQGQWFRFEYHVQWIDVQNLRFRVWPRIYDMAGNLLYDATTYMNSDVARSLAQSYANGHYGVAPELDRVRRIALGYEGNVNATDQGRQWYYAALEVRTDGWAGPVTPR